MDMKDKMDIQLDLFRLSRLLLDNFIAHRIDHMLALPPLTHKGFHYFFYIVRRLYKDGNRQKSHRKIC